MQFERFNGERAAVPSLRSLTYPGEGWRFVVAAVGSAAVLLLVLGLLLAAGVARLVVGVIVLGLIVGLVWLGLQLARARLLGNSVKVTPASFPYLHELVQDVRRQLDYRRRVDVYVTHKSEPSVSLITYLSTHIILIEGGLTAELLAVPNRAQLRFLIARHIGALKARHYRLDVLLVMLNAADALQLAKPFVFPYYRSTAYTGDQIGLACCGSLDAALEATGRLLVGKELAPEMPLGGVVPQACVVKERALPRLAQFLSSDPHAINRYVNLLMYGRLHDIETWQRLCAKLTPTQADDLDELWMGSPHFQRAEAARRPPTAYPPSLDDLPAPELPSRVPVPDLPPPEFPPPQDRSR
jgi:hypothetical protein